jgi:oxygen-independent coproporphyrinogen III oxidase
MQNDFPVIQDVQAADMLDLLSRYAQPGPRYTSYPTADRFVEAIGPEDFLRALQNKRGHAWERAQPIDLYVHIPFCEQICYYCACNKVVTKHKDRGVAYLELLELELDLLKPRLSEKTHIANLHLGGGTPSFLSDASISALLQMIRSRVRVADGAEQAIELDPRTVDAQRVRNLVSMGFRRISMGVQDFDPRVQKAVHREQSVEQVRDLMVAARASGVKSINLDLIHGLPLQTLEGFSKTVNSVVELRPDRVALYGYAHLPQRFAPQRRIHAEQLPTPQDRVQLLSLAIERFSRAGYVYLGMDHFALPDDELAIAHQSGRLRRNFQGYTAQADHDLIGIGVSSISHVGSIYSQNAKTLELYEQSLRQGLLPVERGIALNRDDELRKAVIMSIMCNGNVDFASFNATFLIDFRSYFDTPLTQLQKYEADGLLTSDESGFCLTPKGWFVVRTIASEFDRYLQADRARHAYSRVL